MYSNHLNTGLFWYSNGRFVSDCQMVRDLNGGLTTELKKVFMVPNVRYSNGPPSHVTLSLENWTPILSSILMILVLRFLVFKCYRNHLPGKENFCLNAFLSNAEQNRFELWTFFRNLSSNCHERFCPNRRCVRFHFWPEKKLFWRKIKKNFKSSIPLHSKLKLPQ